MPETETAAGERLTEIRQRHAVLAGRDWSPASHSHASKGCRCLSCYDDPTGWVVDHPGALDCEERVASDANDFGRERESCDSGPLLTYEEADALAHAAEDIGYLLERAGAPLDIELPAGRADPVTQPHDRWSPRYVLITAAFIAAVIGGAGWLCGR